MRRTFLLFGAVILALLLIVNSTKRLSSLRATSQKVNQAQDQLEALRRDNEELKREVEYKKSDQFAEEEIRDKLGLVKKGEALVILPKDGQPEAIVNSEPSTPNYIEWWNLFFRSW